MRIARALNEYHVLHKEDLIWVKRQPNSLHDQAAIRRGTVDMDERTLRELSILYDLLPAAAALQAGTAG